MKDVLRRSPSELRIAEFMRRAGQAIPDRPTIPDEKTRILRAKLILEEALETVRALGVKVICESAALITETRIELDGEGDQLLYEVAYPPDLVEIADGIADIQVVSLGTALSCGIAMEAVQELVDESNLAKFEPPKCKECGSIMDQLLRTQEWTCPNLVCGVEVEPKEAGPYTREDGKHIKPPYWKKPDIEGLLKAQREVVDNPRAERRLAGPTNQDFMESLEGT